jgi:hypothetical protein
MMRPVRCFRSWALCATVTLGVILSACSDTTSPRDVAGKYVLRTVQGMDWRIPGPVDAASLKLEGYVTLYPTGAAERVMQSNGTAATKVEGTFRVRGTSLELRLHETGGSVWTPPATIVGGVLTIRHGSPVDGPDIIEIYSRQ